MLQVSAVCLDCFSSVRKLNHKESDEWIFLYLIRLLVLLQLNKIYQYLKIILLRPISILIITYLRRFNWVLVFSEDTAKRQVTDVSFVPLEAYSGVSSLVMFTLSLVGCSIERTSLDTPPNMFVSSRSKTSGIKPFVTF